eukprot:Opistho-2@7919
MRASCIAAACVIFALVFASAQASHDDGDFPDGGASPVDFSDKEVADALAFAIDTVNARSNSLFRTVLVRPISGTQQVVNGIKYCLTFEAGRSHLCLNTPSAAQDLSLCAVDADSVQQYTVTVVAHASGEANFIALGDVQINPTAPVALGAGAAEPVEPDFPHVQDWTNPTVVGALEAAVERINAMSNSALRNVLVKPVSGSLQTVSGILFRFVLETAESSSCPKSGSKKTLVECPVAAATAHEQWKVKVLAVPWLRTFEVEGEPILVSASQGSSSAASDDAIINALAALLFTTGEKPFDGISLPEMPSVEDPALPEMPSVEDPALPEMPSVEDPALPEMPTEDEPSLPEVPVVVASTDLPQVDFNDQTVVDALHYIVGKIQLMTAYGGLAVFVKGINGTQETGASSGVNVYRLWVQMGVSVKCKPTDTAYSSADCPMDDDSQLQLWRVVVQYKAAEAAGKQFSLAEEPVMVTPSALDSDLSQADVQAAIAWLVSKINEGYNSVNKAVLVKAVSASKQVVAGNLYRLIVDVGLSTKCAKTSTLTDLVNCPVEGGAFERYKASVLYKSWANPQYVFSSAPQKIGDSGTILQSASPSGSSSGSKGGSSTTIILAAAVPGCAVIVVGAAAWIVRQRRSGKDHLYRPLEEGPESHQYKLMNDD